MVVDTLKNIEQYKGLSSDIYAGLQFLASVNKKIELGIYPINKNVEAIVTSYETVYEFEKGYESHKNVIDIQYPIIGIERVKWSPIENMNVNIPYDKSEDRTFFKNPSKQGIDIDIGNGNIIGSIDSVVILLIISCSGSISGSGSGLLWSSILYTIYFNSINN